MKAKLTAVASITVFFLRTIRAAAQFSAFQEIVVDGMLYRGANSSDLETVSNIYERLNNGTKLGIFRRILYSIVGSRILLLAFKNHESNPVIVAINMYYLNRRDVKENTIHEGFIGVMAEAAGKGVATQMRNIAKLHFGSNGIKGISTRISVNNLGSLRSAKKTGFVPVEQYYDSEMKEDRYYMICELQRK